MAAGCVYESLREAHLDQYHAYFVRRGLVYCDSLALLQMHDYASLGVVSMADRVRLFKLVNLIKSSQAEGRTCRHGYSHLPEDTTHGDASVVAANPSHVVTALNIPFPSHSTHTQSNRQDLQTGLPYRPPQHNQEKRPAAPKLARKASARSRAQEESVQFRPVTDSPMFKCRKVLSFSDSEAEDNGDDDFVPTKAREDLPPAQVCPKKEYVAGNYGTQTAGVLHQQQAQLHEQQQDSARSQNYESARSQNYESARSQNYESALSRLEVIKQTIANKSLCSEKDLDEAINVISALLSDSSDESGLSVSQQYSPNNYAATQTSPKKPEAWDILLDDTKHSQFSSKGRRSLSAPRSTNVSQFGASSVNNLQTVGMNTKRRLEGGASVESNVTTKTMEPGHGKPQVKSSQGHEPRQSRLDLYKRQQTATTTVQKTSQVLARSAGPSMAPGSSAQGSSSMSHTSSAPDLSAPGSLWPLGPAVSQAPQTAASSKRGGIAMHIIEKGAVKPKHGVFNAKKQGDLPKKVVEKKVKTLVHTTGYNYGVPSSPVQKSTAHRDGPMDQRIKVCVRKRPLNKRETQRREMDIIKMQEEQEVTVEEAKVAIDLSNFTQEHLFKFDEVFHSECNNEDVYDLTARPLVAHLFKGGRGTCFAYGQTGSGKTYTLLGKNKVCGLYELAGREICARLAQQPATTALSLHISYFEIYCGHLYDLLNKRHRLQVRENGKQQVCITGLMETKVTSASHLKKVVEYGNHYRKIGSTGVNKFSSRSHAILQMELRSFSGRRHGRLSFIDLAGSERAADVTEFDRRTRIEGAEINQSLLALKECIRSLDQVNAHTPYRQSKLTHILRDSFTGNSRTCMIANISPGHSACDNTLNTLRYANRVKSLHSGGANTSRSSGHSGGANNSRASGRPASAVSTVGVASLGAAAPSGAAVPSTTVASSAAAAQTKEDLDLSTAAGDIRPGLFHPSSIQSSSTPIKMMPSGDRSQGQEVISDVLESPISGHRVHGSDRSHSSQGPTAQSVPIPEELRMPGYVFAHPRPATSHKSSPNTLHNYSYRSKSSDGSPRLKPQNTSNSARSASLNRSQKSLAHSRQTFEAYGANTSQGNTSQENTDYGHSGFSSGRGTMSGGSSHGKSGYSHDTSDHGSLQEYQMRPSLDCAAEYLMQVRHRTRQPSDSIPANTSQQVSPYSESGTSSSNTSTSKDLHTDSGTGYASSATTGTPYAATVNTQHKTDNPRHTSIAPSQEDILKQHGHILSNIDEILQRAQAAVGNAYRLSRTSDSKRETDEERPKRETLYTSVSHTEYQTVNGFSEQQNLGDGDFTHHGDSQGSLAISNTHTELHTEVHTELDHTEVHRELYRAKSLTEGSQAGVYYDKHPPLLRSISSGREQGSLKVQNVNQSCETVPSEPRPAWDDVSTSSPVQRGQAALPSPEDFLKSLAQTRLSQKPQDKSAEAPPASSNNQTQSQHGQNFKAVDLSRPFQALLGSPSNERKGTAPGLSQTVEVPAKMQAAAGTYTTQQPSQTGARTLSPADTYTKQPTETGRSLSAAGTYTTQQPSQTSSGLSPAETHTTQAVQPNQTASLSPSPQYSAAPQTNAAGCAGLTRRQHEEPDSGLGGSSAAGKAPHSEDSDSDTLADVPSLRCNVAQAEHVHNMVPQTEYSQNMVPQTEHAHNMVPQTENAHNMVPQSEHSHNMVPQSEHSHNMVPQKMVPEQVIGELHSGSDQCHQENNAGQPGKPPQGDSVTKSSEMVAGGARLERNKPHMLLNQFYRSQVQVGTLQPTTQNGRTSSDELAVIARNRLLNAHEEQLSQITNVCKQEMKLLMSVRAGQMSFPTYIKSLQELLSTKAAYMTSLNSHLDNLL